MLRSRKLLINGYRRMLRTNIKELTNKIWAKLSQLLTTSFTLR